MRLAVRSWLIRGLILAGVAALAGVGWVANSWVSKGPNKDISPNDLAGALGADQISTMMQQSGLSRQELLDGLSQTLPGVIDHLTPDGKLPSADELRRLL